MLVLASAASAAGPMAVQPDGKIVVVGRTIPGAAFVARLNPDGALDPAFGGGDGVVIDHRVNSLSVIAIQPDGKILAGGTNLVRYLPDGSVDESFEESSMIAGSLDGTVRDIQVLPDGRIVVADNYPGDKYFAPRATVQIFSATGLPLQNFKPFGSDSWPASHVESLALLQDGGVLAAGWTPGWTGRLARFLPGSSFTQDPAYKASLNGLEPHAVAAFGTGALVGGASGHEAALARVDNAGIQETGFGMSGLARVDAEPGGSSTFEVVAAQPDGRILATGYGGHDPGNQYQGEYCEACATPLVIRFLEDGSLDPGFATAGIARLRSAASQRIAAKGESLGLVSGGGILVGGEKIAGDSGVVVERLRSDGKADPDFGESGISTVVPCQGDTTEKISSGCLPAVGASLKVRRGRGRPPMLVLRVRPSLGWARMESVHLLAPPGLSFRPSARSTVKAQVTEKSNEGEITRVDVHPHRLTIDGRFGLRAASMRIPPSALEGPVHRTFSRRLKFRIRVSWPVTYGFYKSQTIVVRSVG